VYYRCGGSEGWRFGGHKICNNRQVRADKLEAAVWQDVCGLLNDPSRVEEEYRRRSDPARQPSSVTVASLTKLIQKVKRGIARLIDAYGEGLVDKEEFEPRIRTAKERLAHLEAEAKEQADQETQAAELRLVIGQLQEFAERVRSNLGEADWP